MGCFECQGLCSATNLVFWALDDLVVHSYCVGEGVDVQVLELEVLCEMEGGEGMNWAAAKVCIPSLLHVIEDILHIIHIQSSVLTHAIEQPHQCLSQTLSHKRLPAYPGEEVPCDSTAQQFLFSLCRRRRRNV
jgi:hypothetical protein